MNETYLDRIHGYARHGGIHFEVRVSPQQINQYVDGLSIQERESMYTVMKKLEKDGMITLFNDGLFTDGEGNIGGSTDCGDHPSI